MPHFARFCAILFDVSRSQALLEKSQSRECDEEVLPEVAEEAGGGEKGRAGEGRGGCGTMKGVEVEQEAELEDGELQRRFSENDVR